MANNDKVKLVKLAVGLASVAAVVTATGLIYQTQVLGSPQPGAAVLDQSAGQQPVVAPGLPNQQAPGTNANSGLSGGGSGSDGSQQQPGLFAPAGTPHSRRTRTRHSGG